jgi:hypothetical protein
VALVALVVSSGCNVLSDTPAVSGSQEEATVKGTVRVRGKPVAGGEITFKCANVNRPKAQPRSAPIAKDGGYEIKTLIGQNYVEVSCTELNRKENRELRDREWAFMVNSGENTIQIDIPATAQGK